MARRDTYMIDSAGRSIFEGDIVRMLWGGIFIGGIQINKYAYHEIRFNGHGRDPWGISGCANLISGRELTVTDALPAGVKLHEWVDENNVSVSERLAAIPEYRAMADVFASDLKRRLRANKSPLRDAIAKSE